VGNLQCRLIYFGKHESPAFRLEWTPE